jgi:hypothetical protein
VDFLFQNVSGVSHDERWVARGSVSRMLVGRLSANLGMTLPFLMLGPHG